MKYFYGVGRRKRSTARSKYYPVETELSISVNGKPGDEYFPQYFYQTLTTMLSHVAVKSGKFELFIRGGGDTGQSDAARLAMAKSLVKYDDSFRSVLRMYGYMTTDIRKVLPKRPGLRKARKREQWSKR